jgi:DNA adenine methylase
MLIPYLGEKTSISSFITPNIPEDISTYVEPFGGMFGVFFALRFSKFRDVKFVYNDINYLNYNLFNQLKNNTDFINLVNETKVNQEIYKKSLLDIFKEKDNTQLALDWLVILTCSSPYEVGKYSWRDDSEFEVFKMKWKAYQFHVNKINEIHNLDYKKIIEMYDSESTFFYLDPPYMGRENLYLNHNFKEETHKELSEVLKNIKGRFLLSYYYFDGIEDYYTDCRFESSKTLMGTEYLIMNY